MSAGRDESSPPPDVRVNTTDGRPSQEDSMAFHPYLNFGGNCREAFTRYQEIFGGELVLLRMADMPPEPRYAPTRPT
jgi:hypothetical protein